MSDISEAVSLGHAAGDGRSPHSRSLAAHTAALRRKTWLLAFPLMIVVSSLSVARLAVIGFSLLILVPAGVAWVAATMALMLRPPRQV